MLRIRERIKLTRYMIKLIFAVQAKVLISVISVISISKKQLLFYPDLLYLLYFIAIINHTSWFYTIC